MQSQAEALQSAREALASIAVEHTDDIEARLDALQRDSEARRDELKAIAAALPEATSRRAYLTSMVRGVAAAPDKTTVVKRTVLKLLRTPADLFRSRSR